MANITQLKHLEHIEDEMLNYGVEGCHASVRAMKELLRMMGKKSKPFVQTKWDGAPSVVCGKDPVTGFFFVGTKSVFAKTEPKLCFNEDQIDGWYSGDLAEKLKFSLRYFSQLGIDGVVQGDLLFTTDKKKEKVEGEDLITFRPNTITYGIPVNHVIGKKVDAAKIGIVFHTHYEGDNLPTMTAKAGAPIHTFNQIPEVAVIDNDTPYHDIAVPRATLGTFNRHVQTIERMCAICGPFLNELVDNMGTTGDKKFHVASFLKQFFNSEIKQARTITNVQTTMKRLGSFYHEKMMKEIDKVKSDKAKTAKRMLLYSGLEYIEQHQREFNAMLAMYKKMQEAKQLVIDQLDHLETFRTYVQTPNGYRLTNPEGYVLHHNGDMIKLVNRIEFSYINFTLSKEWK